MENAEAEAGSLGVGAWASFRTSAGRGPSLSFLTPIFQRITLDVKVI